MLCVLFDAHLLFATPGRDGKSFELFAVIGTQFEIERCDDGHGKCHYHIIESLLRRSRPPMFERSTLLEITIHLPLLRA